MRYAVKDGELREHNGHGGYRWILTRPDGTEEAVSMWKAHSMLREAEFPDPIGYVSIKNLQNMIVDLPNYVLDYVMEIPAWKKIVDESIYR